MCCAPTLSPHPGCSPSPAQPSPVQCPNLTAGNARCSSPEVDRANAAATSAACSCYLSPHDTPSCLACGPSVSSAVVFGGCRYSLWWDPDVPRSRDVTNAVGVVVCGGELGRRPRLTRRSVIQPVSHSVIRSLVNLLLDYEIVGEGLKGKRNVRPRGKWCFVYSRAHIRPVPM